MAREIYDKNNFEHDQFHGTQEWLDKDNARWRILQMIQDGDVSSGYKERAFRRIDKYVTKEIDGVLKIKVWEWKKDVDWNTISTYVEL